MSKAILVIDMPNCCGNCDLSRYEDVHLINCLNHIADEDEDKLPKWCPLKELPQFKVPIENDESGFNDYVGGWNDCLYEILEEENEQLDLDLGLPRVKGK